MMTMNNIIAEAIMKKILKMIILINLVGKDRKMKKKMMKMTNNKFTIMEMEMMTKMMMNIIQTLISTIIKICNTKIKFLQTKMLSKEEETTQAATFVESMMMLIIKITLTTRITMENTKRI